ncbi:MAG: hypothetical protein CMB96_04725 [Flavobacteriaceae bacterium]|nr:hypothetical protein [Flavobacteriaceae bacterium]|tara:strand:+ start:5230 stop:5547 length:318 start_codon:yes stop_codon:yes gene_type:complete
MALIKHSRATNIFKAFLINAFVAALVATIIVEVRRDLNEDKSGIFQIIHNIASRFDSNPFKTAPRKMFYTFITGFVVSLIIYNILYVLIGFGGGMIANKKQAKYF